MSEPDYSKLPGRYREEIYSWIEHREAPSTLVTEVLVGSLARVVEAADRAGLAREEMAELMDVAWWLYTEAPNGCWGAPDFVESWRTNTVPQPRPDLSKVDRLLTEALTHVDCPDYQDELGSHSWAIKDIIEAIRALAEVVGR